MKILVGLIFIEDWVFEDFVFNRYALDDGEHIEGTDICNRLHEGCYWMVLE